MNNSINKQPDTKLAALALGAQACPKNNKEKKQNKNKTKKQDKQKEKNYYTIRARSQTHLPHPLNKKR